MISDREGSVFRESVTGNYFSEDKVFQNDVTKDVLSKWCRINDGLSLSVTSREIYEQKKKENQVIEGDGELKILSLPDDLQLYELPGVIQIIDGDTFSTQPERQQQRQKAYKEVGKLLKDSAVYIYSRFDLCNQGKDIASSLAMNFMEYGYTLENGRKMEKNEILESFVGIKLTGEEIEAVEKFLIGEDLYKSRKERLDNEIAISGQNKEEAYEELRVKTLSSFFRTLDLAFKLEEKENRQKSTLDTSEPWKIRESVHTYFIKKLTSAIIKKVESPKTDLYLSIYERGEKKLLDNMEAVSWRSSLNFQFKKLSIDLKLSEKTLYESLNVPRLKKELKDVRQSQNPKKITDKEREIAEKIQRKIKRLYYWPEANIPSEMVKQRLINCVGASILGGALMDEIGLNYLVADVPGHSLLVLLTTDGGVEWRDMILTLENEKLTDDMISGFKSDGSRLTLNDIIQYSKKPTGEGISFEIDKSKYPNKFSWIGKQHKQTVVLREPKYGQQFQIMNNMGAFQIKYKEGDVLSKMKIDKGIQFITELISIAPEKSIYYDIMAKLLEKSDDKREKSIYYYQKAISLDPDNVEFYIDFGNCLISLGQREAGQKSFDKAISLTPIENYDSLGFKFLCLKYYDEAIKSFNKALDAKINNKNSAYLHLSLAYLAKGENDMANEYLQNINNDNSKASVSYNDLAAIFRSIDNKENEIKAYCLAIKYNQANEDSYLSLMSSLYGEKLYNQILEVAPLAIKNGFKNEDIYMYLSSALVALNRYDEAIDVCRQQIEVNPKSATAYRELGSCLVAAGKNEEAKEVLLKAIDLFKKQPWSVFKDLDINLAKMELESLDFE